jgi:cell division protein FtsN
MSFISGLGVGLLVAFAVYLWSGHLRIPDATAVAPALPALLDEPPVELPEEPPPIAELPRPTFDFYKILPEMEVPIPDWEPGDVPAATVEQVEEPAAAVEEAAPATLDQGTYLLQVGSFKAFEDADRVKATLALHGVTASIQRVVINGQDVWYRVHIGPLANEEEIRDMRIRLLENDMDSILLRIGDSRAATSP